MKKLILLLLFIPLISCSGDDEETRIFTITVKAMPPEGGTVTLETTQLTTNEYLWGDNAFIKAKPADGYLFENFEANTYLGAFIETSGGWDQHNTNTKLYKSLELRCNDEDSRARHEHASDEVWRRSSAMKHEGPSGAPRASRGIGPCASQSSQGVQGVSAVFTVF